ncbi:MAG: hypothetical protein VX938_07145, partial [Myxococcota bacterium]|nr:hypothetical protein [Myxococcota bacterium]
NDFNLGVDYTEIRGVIAFYPSSGSVGSWTTSGAHPDNDNYSGYASDTGYTLDAGGTGGNRSWHRWGKPGQVLHVHSTLGWTGEWQSQKTLSFDAISVVGGSVVRFSTFSESGAVPHERWAFAPTLYVR